MQKIHTDPLFDNSATYLTRDVSHFGSTPYQNIDPETQFDPDDEHIIDIFLNTYPRLAVGAPDVDVDFAALCGILPTAEVLLVEAPSSVPAMYVANYAVAEDPPLEMGGAAAVFWVGWGGTCWVGRWVGRHVF